MPKTVEYKGERYTFEPVQERDARIEKIALDILEKCKGEALTVREFYMLMDKLKSIAECSTTLGG